MSSQCKRSNTHLTPNISSFICFRPIYVTWGKQFLFFFTCVSPQRNHCKVSLSQLHNFVWIIERENIYTGINLFYRHFGSIFSCHSLKLLCKFYCNLNAGVFQFHDYCTYHATSYRWRRKGKICTVGTVSLVELFFICLFL